MMNIEVIVGTYEEFLLGYKVEEKNEKTILTQSFADKSHSGAIKCLAVHGPWIATGSTDDRIFVYDMRTRKQAEILLGHEGTINALTFAPDETHLFSGGEDGRMIATQVNNWKTSADWKKAHNGSAITHISCHPSGKLALTLGSDLVLRTWNLVKGRVAYKSNLKSRNSLGRAIDCLEWSPSGDYFTLSGQRIVEIWSIQKADVIRSQKTNSKPISLCWINDDVFLTGLEDGKIQWVHVKENDEQLLVEAHSTRVKSMKVVDETLVTASSSGEIKIWHINISERKLTEIASTNIGCRPTCVGILNLDQFGSNYKINAATEDTKVSISKIAKKPETQRGVVTIEYENESDEGEDVKNQSNKSSVKVSSDEEEDKEQSDEYLSSDNSEEETFIKAKKRKVHQKLSNAKRLKNANINEKSNNKNSQIKNKSNKQKNKK